MSQAVKDKFKANNSSPARRTTDTRPDRQRPLLVLLKGAVLSCVGPNVGEKRWEQNELLDTVYWIRQLVALLTGLLWGAIPLTGLYAFLGAIVANAGPLLYWTSLQQLDLEEYGGATVVNNEGFAPALATFMLAWIGTYTMLHS